MHSKTSKNGGMEIPKERGSDFRKDPILWNAEPNVGRVANGVSYWMDEPRGVPRIIVNQKDRANRLKALGNAIVPQNAKLIGLAIKKELGLT